tara:strand:- start:17 stop:502 length:486 start_codon:yes stop_codon:yes gene_type:complete
METKYNAYRVYSTGRRVKKPTIVFDLKEYEFFDDLDINSDDFDGEKIFLDKIVPTLDKKFGRYKFEVIRKDLPQEPKIDKSIEEEKRKQKQRTIFLGKIAARKLSNFASERSTVSLDCRPETEWKWQWCLSQAGTNKFFGHLSSSFDTRAEAQEWLENSIN